MNKNEIQSFIIWHSDEEVTKSKNNNMKKKDDELKVYLIVWGVFAVTLVGVDIFFSAWVEMGTVLKFTASFLHGVAITATIISLRHFKDPNYDWTRRLAVIGIIVSLITVAGHKVYVNEANQVLIDSEKAKQEQPK